MSSDNTLFERLTLGILNTLEKRSGICNINLVKKNPADRSNVISWEQKYSCMMPDDARNFYLTSDGLTLTWSVKMNDARVPVGRMEINSLDSMTRLGGTMSAADQRSTVPTLKDVEIDSDEDEETKDVAKPKFDHRSRIFELDHCEGYGKVCYVYKNTKPGIPAQKAEVWFLDRSLQWHFLADGFTNYYRMMLVHLGLPQWQYTFTDIGLSPQAKQWFNLYSPVRLGLDGEFYDPTLEGEKPAPITQLDISKVFKGKSDKKKIAPAQNMKRKPMPSAKSQGPGSGTRPSGFSAPQSKVIR